MGDVFPLTVSAGRQSCTAQHPARLMSHFEGLGFNCEFGNVQRASGFEPLGLFRFALLTYEHMIKLLETRFEGVDDPDLIEVKTLADNDEWWGTNETFGIRYHTHRSSKHVPADVALADERVKLKYLKRKLLDDLEEPTKIFVRSEERRSLEEMRAGFAALRNYGDHKLLWVLEAPEPHLVGVVETIEPGLVLGYIRKLDEIAAPSRDSVAIWHRVLIKTLRTLQPDVAEVFDGAEANKPSGPITAPQVWFAKGYTRNVVANEKAPRFGNEPVLEHTLLRQTTFPEHEVLACGPSGLEPGAAYVASLWIWLPDAFAGTVGILFPGSSAIWNFSIDVALRCRWQMLASSVRLKPHLHHHYPTLVVEGAEGCRFYSTRWRFERGVVPDMEGIEDVVLYGQLPDV